MTTPSATIAIAVRGFSYQAGPRTILNDVTFDVRQGEYLSIVGPNGAGKTTLLKCLQRIVTGGRGAVEIDGRPLGHYSQRRLALQLSYVPQADSRLPPFSVEQFVLLGRYPHVRPLSGFGKHDHQVARQALELTGTLDLASRRLATLSGGERQKVYIAAALAQEARILLLDEPTTFLDYRHQAEIRAVLARVNRQQGVTIVAVTHDVNTAAAESHRALALQAGRVVFSGPAAALMDAAVLQRIYGTPFLLVAHPQTGLPMVVPPVVEEGQP